MKNKTITTIFLTSILTVMWCSAAWAADRFNTRNHRQTRRIHQGSLIYKSNRFRNTSEVYRAAIYIGMSILYQLTKDEGTPEQKARADQIYKTIEIMESLNHDRQSIDAVVWAAKDLIDCADTGVIDYEEMNEKTSMLVNALPKELCPVARAKIKRIMKGDSIVDIAETKVQRGTKRLKKRSV